MSLESEAKTLKELVDVTLRDRFAIQRGSDTYDNDKKYFEEMMATKWVRLEDAQNQIKQELKVLLELSRQDCEQRVELIKERFFREIDRLNRENVRLEGCLEKLPQTIDEIAERVRRKLDLTRSSGAAVFAVAVSMLKDELKKETKP